VGVCAPQGAGKSTLCERLVAMLGERGLRAVTLSIDDVYLTREQQRRLASEHPGNRYLEVRGYPGTHDVALGERVLDALLRAEAHESLRVPCYDKGAFDGAGDRAPVDRWPTVEGPFDVVLFEGWMLAFSPVDPALLADDPALVECNERLGAYEGWRARVDRWALLRGERVEYVIDWRIEAEQKRRAREGRGLTDEQARAYVERFVPAYQRWGARIEQQIHRPKLTAVLAADRSVIACEAEP
jgi:D-glycerate 3-kinase